MATNEIYPGKQVNVSSSIDSSAKLQEIINNTGNVQAEFIFSENCEIEVSSPIRFYPGVKVSGNGMTFRLKDKVSRTVFPSMVPILGAKISGGTGFEFSNLIFDGNFANQSIPLGKGFDNFIGLSKASKITIQGCNIHDSAGDGARLTDVKNVLWEDNKIYRCGHDALYVDKGSDITARNNYTELRTNSAIRFRHVNGGHAHDNVIINKVAGKASSPGIQIENSTSGMTSRNLVIENNEIRDTWGPGIWIIGTSNTSLSAASGLDIKNNLFVNCGNMDSSYHHIPGVGGITCEGWDQVLIEGNKFEGCKGYGVLFGEYVSASASGSGYSATVRRNTFTGTKKANYIGTASGTALANLKPQKYTKVTAQGNNYSGNVRDLYNVVEIPEPLIENPSYLMFDCSEEESSKLKQALPERDILRRS